ncbi:DNA alkylation repair protein [bacterium]|nr:DNA alkylation repair protein [bacterium]
MAERKGARSRNAIPPEILAQLNAGTLAAATLSEGLAIDFAVLLKHVAPELPPRLAQTLRPTDGIKLRMQTAGSILLEHYGLGEIDRFRQHTSDTVRGWSAYMIAAPPDLTLTQRLKFMQPLGDDDHFGVREWAWMAVRPAVAADIQSALRHLKPWVKSASPNTRRFACEVTRPRGVWCTHIAELKEQPELALPLLEPLRSDDSKYVRDSVGNWLNDAAKSQPAWVRELCQSWEQESPTAETRYIVKRALRSL